MGEQRKGRTSALASTLRLLTVLAAPGLGAEINPYTSQLYSNMRNVIVTDYTPTRALFNRFDLLHFHWPDQYIPKNFSMKWWLRLAFLTMVVCITHLRRSRVVWTVHNLLPHDTPYPRFSKLYLEWFARHCGGLIFLSATSRSTFYHMYPEVKTPYAVIPHGHYREVYPRVPERMAARRLLGLSAAGKILLFVGLIRPYKNVLHLIATFRKWSRPDTYLVIAGEPDAAMKAALASTSCSDRVILRLGFVPNDELVALLAASDAVVLPYRNILNSGAVLLALSCNRKVVAPAIGSLTELTNQLPAGWLELYHGELSPGHLEAALQPPPRCTCDLAAFDWPELARQTVSFYKQISARTT
jgi:beta-1,4-mannosyltransferase